MSNLIKNSLLLFFLFGLLVAIGCKSTPPESLDPKEVSWQNYSNSKIGVSLNYPDVYTINEDRDGDGVIFRHKGKSALLLRFMDEEESKHRGLWFGHKPQAEIELGGKKGFQYDYNHGDGPFFSRTVSYVVEYRDKYLGLEFRTDNTDLDEVQQKVLSSFRFL